MRKSNKIMLAVIILLSILIIALVTMGVYFMMMTPNSVGDNTSEDVISTQMSSNSEIQSSDNVIIADNIKPSTPQVSVPQSSVLQSSISEEVSSTTQSSSIIEESSNQEITSSENFEAEQRLFKQLYTMAETQYKAEITSKIQTYKTELNAWEDKYEEYSQQKYYEKVRLDEKFANMGIYNSGQHKTAINNLNNKYSSLLSECNTNISKLSKEIAALEKEKQNPDPNSVLALVAYNNGMTAAEVAEKYHKYME